jgi:uncharacterized RDD family membrane protein YckC
VSELVTGEAVALELLPARLPSRALALLIDLLVATTVYVTVTVAMMASTSSLDDSAEAAVAVASFVLLLVGGPVAVETLSHGRSLGKLACGLRVVRDDGGPIRFRHALVRGGVGVVEILLSVGTVACLASLVSARGRRVGDVLAGTLVVRERVPAAPVCLVPPPHPSMTGRFAGLDLSGVPDGLWLAVRQYLMRMRQLDPEVSGAMAARLASDVAAHTGAPVPADVPPEAYLAAVMHERQARDASRAFGSGVVSSGTDGAGGVDRPGEFEDAGVVPDGPAEDLRSASRLATARWGAEWQEVDGSGADPDAPAGQDGAAEARGADASGAVTGFVPPA